MSKSGPGSLKELRQRATAQLKELQTAGKRARKASAAASVYDRQKLLSELSIHQIELEMQNKELRDSREEIERAREWYFSLFDLAPVPYFVFGPDQLIQEVNFAAAQLMRKDRVACRSIRLSSMLDERGREALRQHLSSVFGNKDGKSHTVALRIVHNETEYNDIELTSHCLRKSGDTKSICLSSCVDMTERNKTLEELRLAKIDAEAAASAKTEFLANMSHEIRTPLTSILMFAQLLKRKTFNDDKREVFIESIARNAAHLNSLISDILDLTKLEAGRLDMNSEAISVASFVQEVIDSIQSLASQKNLPVNLSIAEGTPRTVMGDSTRLRQILINVVGNAIKFTPSGSVTIEVKTNNTQNIIFFNIIDTGVGIDSSVQSHLFTQFSQADGSTTRKFGGTGLGLYLSRKLARMLGGDLYLASSVYGQGSTFCLALPCEPTQQLRRLVPIEPPMVVGATLKGAKILVVEDTRDTCVALTEFFEKEGSVVDVVNSGDAALTKCESIRYDAILMDLHMPGLSGYEVTRLLKSRGLETPIIAFTADSSAKAKQRISEAGFSELLPKPIQLNHLRTCLIRWVAHLG